MALDIAILGRDGAPESTIQIGVGAHVRLMEVVEAERLQLLGRMNDYYEDADYETDEIGALLAEVEIALSNSQHDAELETFLVEFRNLASMASTRGASLAAIAD